MDFHIYNTVNLPVMNYFGTKLPDTGKIDGQMKTELNSESAELHGKDLTELEDHFTATEVYTAIEKPSDFDCKAFTCRVI